MKTLLLSFFVSFNVMAIDIPNQNCMVKLPSYNTTNDIYINASQVAAIESNTNFSVVSLSGTTTSLIVKSDPSTILEEISKQCSKKQK